MCSKLMDIFPRLAIMMAVRCIMVALVLSQAEAENTHKHLPSSSSQPSMKIVSAKGVRARPSLLMSCYSIVVVQYGIHNNHTVRTGWREDWRLTPTQQLKWNELARYRNLGSFLVHLINVGGLMMVYRNQHSSDQGNRSMVFVWKGWSCDGGDPTLLPPPPFSRWATWLVPTNVFRADDEDLISWTFLFHTPWEPILYA